MIIVLLGILLAAFGVFAWLWLALQKETALAQESLAVPLADIKTMQPLVDPAVDHREALDAQRLVYEDRLRELKEELKAVQQKVQEGESGSAGVLVALQGENEKLKVTLADLQSAAVQADHDAGKLDHLIVESSALRAQVVEMSSETLRLKDVVLRLEQENQRLNSVSHEVGDAQQLVQQAKEAYQCQLDNLYQETETLRTENTKLQEQVRGAVEVDALRESVGVLAGQVKELEMINAAYTEKNEYLQYELTKSRAQVVGLERVCENSLG